MRTSLRVTAAVVVVVSTMLGGLGASALAASSDKVAISGVGTFDGTSENPGKCDELESLFTIKMTGVLEGCWYQTDIPYVKETPSGIYQERGYETFIGCLVVDGLEAACGAFDTTYKFTGKFAPDGSEIHGRCQHPIVGGADGFASVTGRVDFKDDVTTGEFIYRGHIDFS